MKKFILTTIVMIFLLAFTASALPVTVEKVEFSGTEVFENNENLLSIERGSSFDIDIEFSADEDASDIELEAFISGYEYNDVDPIYDRVHIFDIEGDVIYTRTMSLKLPTDVERDDYKVRILFTDRNGEAVSMNYDIRVDTPRHSIAAEDIVINPEDEVKAGRSLLTTVLLENLGQKDEENVKVTVAIPELGLSDADYIKKIEQGETEETEEIFLRVPRCSEAGAYELEVTVEYDRRRDSFTETRTIYVTEDDECSLNKMDDVQMGADSLNIKAGESGLFTVLVTNNQHSTKAFTLSLDGNEDWAQVSISPTASAILKPGQSKEFVVVVDADNKAEGMKTLTASISSSGTQLDTQEIKVNVEERDFNMLLNFLQVLLTIGIIGLVILGLYFGFNKLQSNKAELYY